MYFLMFPLKNLLDFLIITLFTGNPIVILEVDQGQGHMTEKEVVIETGIDMYMTNIPISHK